MNKENFLEKMVDKCEVKSFQEVYYKIVKKNNHIVRCENVFKDNPKFSLEKIRQDVLNIDNVLYLELFKLEESKQKFFQLKDKSLTFEKEPYLLTPIGLERVIKLYRKKNVLKKKNEMQFVLNLWGIKDKEREKFIKFLEKALENTSIYANIIKDKKKNKNKNKYLYFYSFLEVPKKRKKLLQLFLTIFLFIAILFVLIKVSNFL